MTGGRTRWPPGGLLALVLCLAAGAPALAQVGIGQVNGTIFDAARKGVPGLSVAVIPEDGRALYGTSTDADGRYGVKGMPPGNYSVVVALPGGAVRKDGIRIRPLFRSIVDFNLGPEPAATALPPLHAGEAPASPKPAVAARSGALAGRSLPGPWAGLSTEPASGSAGSADADDGTAPPAAGAAPEAAGTDPDHSESPQPAETTPAADEAGMELAWALHGPEKASAPDAWVAAIPAKGAGHLRRDRTRPDGGVRLHGVEPGSYSLLVKAAGYMTWRMGPLQLDGDGELAITMTLVPYPMGFKGTIEDVLIPIDPIPLDLK